MKKKTLKTYSLSAMKDKYFKKDDNKKIDTHEYTLRKDVLDQLSKTRRRQRNLYRE